MGQPTDKQLDRKLARMRAEYEKIQYPNKNRVVNPIVVHRTSMQQQTINTNTVRPRTPFGMLD